MPPCKRRTLGDRITRFAISRQSDDIRDEASAPRRPCALDDQRCARMQNRPKWHITLGTNNQRSCCIAAEPGKGANTCRGKSSAEVTPKVIASARSAVSKGFQAAIALAPRWVLTTSPGGPMAPARHHAATDTDTAARRWPVTSKMKWTSMSLVRTQRLNHTVVPGSSLARSPSASTRIRSVLRS